MSYRVFQSSGLALLVLLAVWVVGCGPCKVTAEAAKPVEILTPAEQQDGWLALFDGETLFGWKSSSNADWAVRDGVLTASQGEPGLLHTTTEFSDFVLKVEFRATASTNSGVFLRTIPNPTKEDVASKCYELNIAPASNPFPTGSFVERKKSEASPDSNEWRKYEVIARGGRFVVNLDGREVLDYTDPKPVARGFIGLQFREGKIEFRNVKLKPLGLVELFNGKDLAGWKTHPDSKSVCTVTPEGCIRIQNGKGQLESEGKFGDFVFQTDVFVSAPGLNSGVFFRSIPGEMMNGYESQIENRFKDNDRTKPADCGTGGIFRRINARKVVANDREWFTKTIVAVGPHVSVWVNGYQVTDWTDDRKPDPNPRKGLRTEPGTIIFQGHDPTTDLLFRNIRAVELPK